MIVSKKKQKHPESAATTLDEIQSMGDRLAEWIGENRVLVMSVAVAILVVAAGWGIFTSSQNRAGEAASADLARVQGEYMSAMGSSPGDIEVVEHANPETARSTRTEFEGRFREVAEEHEGNASGTLAWLQVGVLQLELGDRVAAIETWSAAADGLGRDNLLRAMLLERIAAAQEDEGRFEDAARSYEAASEVPSYPLGHAALAEAARCYAEAGDTARAVALFDRLEGIEPRPQIPDSTRARLRELRALQSM